MTRGELAGRLSQHSNAAALLADGVDRSTALVVESLAGHFRPAETEAFIAAMRAAARALRLIQVEAARLAVRAATGTRPGP